MKVINLYDRAIIAISKFSMKLSRMAGWSGTALPGMLAEKLAPNLLEKYASQFTGGIILITGTNGKTTTAKLIDALLSTNNGRVLSNRSGSNYTRGLLSTLIDATNKGRLDYDWIVFEVDEAYTPMIAHVFKPDVITVLNISRDQLDRYGEIDNTMRTIASACGYANKIVLNANDPTVIQILDYVDDKTTVEYFSASRKLIPELAFEPSRTSANHLQAKKQTVVETYSRRSRTDATVRLRDENGTYNIRTKLEGVHNATNIAAALRTVKALTGQLTKRQLQALAKVDPPFGRGEIIKADKNNLHLALIKNPSGFRRNIATYKDLGADVLLLVINDKYADGRDVSWLWDVDVAAIKQYKKMPDVYVSGIRAYDMALRLQYAGIGIKQVEPDVSLTLDQIISDINKNKANKTRDIVIMPTYTAMLNIRNLISKRFNLNLKELWQ